MAYTNDQLLDIYEQLNIGADGSAADRATVTALAQQTRIGQLSDGEALAAVYDLVDDTTGVAALTYQFFTGALPSAGGFQYLVNSPTNTTDLNDAYYAGFNQENRFINFSLNLALEGEGADDFAATYGGATTLKQAIAIAYEKVIGTAAAQAAGIDVEAAINYLSNDANVAFYRQLAVERGGISATDPKFDLAVKAIAIAEVMNAAVSEDLGNYASALNQFYASLHDGVAGSPGYGNDLLDSFPPAAEVTLTAFADTVTGNVFNAPRTFTPGGDEQMNTLNDDDVLTGVGANPTLNLTYVNETDGFDASIAPTLIGIETINVDFRADTSSNLDLQDATGVANLNLKGVDDGAAAIVSNIQSGSGFNLSISNSHAPTSEVAVLFDADYVDGDSDEINITLNNAEIGELDVESHDTGGGEVYEEGFEFINLVSTGGSNRFAFAYFGDAQVITLTGDSNLTTGWTNPVVNSSENVEALRYNETFQHVDGSLHTFDAHAFKGDLEVTFGSEVSANKDGSSGVQIDFTFKGGEGDDTVRLLGAMDSAKDNFDGGAGDNLFAIYNSVTKGSVTNFQDLEVRGQSDAGVQTIDVDTSLFADLETILVRNEGNDGSVPTAAPDALDLTVNLNNLSAAVAAAITVLHGTTENNGIDDLEVNTTFKTNTANDTVAVAIEDGVNTDPRFNFTLGAAGAENVTIHDNDTESNSVYVSTVGTVTGVLTVDGGQTGRFLNFDTEGGTVGKAGLYLLDTDGSASDGTGIVDLGAAASEHFVGDVNAADFIGNLIVRVDNKAGKSYVLGSGDDTIIFDTNNDTRAGLTISDTVNGGDGKDILAIDGHGVKITLGASEWTNVSNFETILLVGNGNTGGNAGEYGKNDYNLRLTNDLIATNGAAVAGGRRIIIDNDSDNANATEGGVTIDARFLDAKSSFQYDGEEHTKAGDQGATDDRFIMADANINGLALIDGGVENFGLAGGNDDVLEVRNSAIVTIGDLQGISNVGTIEFTNDTAAVQQSVLEIDDATIDRLVNTSHVSKVGDVETLNINVAGNPLVSGAATELTIEDSGVTGATAYVVNVSGDTAVTVESGGAAINGDAGDNNITGGAGDDTIDGQAGNDVLNGAGGDDAITGGTGIDVLTGGAGADQFIFADGDSGITDATADEITDFVLADGDTLVFSGGAGSATNYDEDAAAVATFALALANADGGGLGAGVIYYATEVTGAGVYVFHDADGDGAADQAVLLTGVTLGTIDETAFGA